uniref:Core domain-containing protein n=1 Tax=Manihot esculenta TaxID=3983 RepID=A0A2C9V855_MANES
MFYMSSQAFLGGNLILELVVPQAAQDISSKFMSYEKGKFDELVEEKGVKILIDPKALMHVIGTKMDFVDDKLRSEFIFINPNSKGQCGCGESFMTRTNAGGAKQGSNR